MLLPSASLCCRPSPASRRSSPLHERLPSHISSSLLRGHAFTVQPWSPEFPLLQALWPDRGSQSGTRQMGLCPPGASSPRREDATEASAQAQVHTEAQGHRGAGGGGEGPPHLQSHRPPSLSSPKCISERPTSSRVSRLTSDNPMVGGRAPKCTCVDCTSPGGQWGPSSCPLALLLQPISEKAWAICDSCQPGRISSGIHLRAPQTPLVPETLPLKTPPGLPTVQVLPGPHGSTPSPFAVLSPDSETRWGRGTGLLSVGLMATHSRRPHCRPLALLWDPVQAAPVRPQSSSVPVSAFPISPTPLSLRPTPLL